MRSLILGVSVLLLSVSCRDVGTECGPFDSPRYDITGIEVAPVTYSELPQSIGYRVTTTTLDTANSVNANQFILELSANVVSDPAYVKNSPSFSFSLMSQAYACSPVGPYTEEKISQLNIISDNDFSADYPAGSNLNVLFNVLYNEQATPRHTDNNGEHTAYTVAEYVESTPKATQLIQLRLNQAPGEIKTHQFTLNYMHNDGEQFSVSTAVITFE